MPVAGGPAPAGQGQTLTIFGRKISWDALLIAGAGLAGVILLYKAGQPSTAVGSATPSATDTTGATSTPLNPTQSAATPVPASSPASSFVSASSSAYAPIKAAPVLSTSTQQAAALQAVAPSVKAAALNLQNLFRQPAPAAAPVAIVPFNPIRPRSSGNQAVL